VSGTISSKPSTDHVEFTEADVNEEWFLDMGESQREEFSGVEAGLLGLVPLVSMGRLEVGCNGSCYAW
jgi:hypothetical protein